MASNIRKTSKINAKTRSMPTKFIKPSSKQLRKSTKPTDSLSKQSDVPAETSDVPCASDDEEANPEEDENAYMTKPGIESTDLEADVSMPSEEAVKQDTGREDSVKLVEKRVFLKLKDNRCSRINVKINGDMFTPQVSACCFMPDGSLIVCDYKNQKVKILDSNFTLKGDIFLPTGPFDVGKIDKNSIVVTLPAKKQLQFINIFPSLNTGSVIEVNKECYGVDVAADLIYVTSYTAYNNDGEVLVYDIKGSLLSSLRVYKFGSHEHRRLENVAVNRTGNKIYLPDWETDTVICLTDGGKLVYQYQDAELESPRGLYVDEENNVIICGHESRSIQAITPEGKKHNTLISDMLAGPCGIAISPSDGTLVIGCSNSETMFCYKLS